MRILVAQNIQRSSPGGMSRIMEFLHRPLVGSGHYVDFLCREDVPPIARGHFGRFAFPWLVRRRAMRAAGEGQPYDIVNVHEPSSVVVATMRRGMGNPAVVAMSHGVEQRAWDLAFEEQRRGRGGPRLANRVWYPLSSLWQSLVGLTRADGVLCLSFEDRDYLIANFGIDADRITRVFPGADPIFAQAAAVRDYASASRVVFAGTWRKNKGIEDLVPAFAELARRSADVSLMVLGAGVPDNVVHAAFPEVARGRVITGSTQTDADTARVLANCDLFVLPSLFEGTPLTLIEAMMSGLPIVTTDTCGMKDVIRDGTNGLLVPMRSPGRLVEAIETIRGDAELRAKLGGAARADAQRLYTWDRASAIVLGAYERLLTRRPTGIVP